MNEIKNHQKKKIKIGLLGDQGVGKSTFINNFISSTGETNLFQNNSYKDIQKIISQLPFIIDFYEFNTNNDKYISHIQDCHVILIMFDLNNRNSFDNLNDCWLYFLKNHCYYENDIYILGNYIDKSSAPLTSSEEINEMIKFLEIPIANYIEVGNKTNEELNKLIDELVFHTYIDDLKNVKEDCKGGSFKVDKCIIY